LQIFTSDNINTDFIIELAEKLCRAERNYKGRGFPQVLHLKRIQEGAGDDMTHHNKNRNPHIPVKQSNTEKL